jgi:RNA polymerase sigma factor (sigma-70 family)
MQMARDTRVETGKTDIGDEALMMLYANGDATAARLLMDRLLPGVLRYAARVLGDRAEAEDVAQEAMLQLWRVAKEWRQGEAQPRTWVYQVAANPCTDWLRLRKWRAASALDEIAEPVNPGQSTLAGVMTLKGLTPYEFICKQWTIEPERFTLNPIHQIPGLNT